MSRLVLSALVSSLLILNLVQSSPLDDWDHPITYKERKLALRNERADANYRLSGDVFPKNYDIWIRSQLHEQSLAFSGEVKITVQAARSTSSITLHALQMKILEADLKDLTTDETFMLYFELDTVTDLLTFRSGHVEQLNLIPGREYLLIIKYEGNLRRDNGGFYLSTYLNSNNQQVNIATTQFQATDARHAFPCFDEPGFKATYDIAITHGSNYNALSNMPILRIENTSPSTKTTYFQTTPLMSTYLVAFIISGFESTQGQQGSVLHRVFSTPETKNMQQYALTTSQKALNYLADYLSVPYGLPKLDNVAIPDFGAGAMENWGLVTYREEFLLFDRAKSSVNTELNIAITVAHELAHQWFGNLVTPKWWQHLWLNEGFATLYEYLTVNAIYPEHNIMQNFAVSHYLRALLNDGQKNPRAMSTNVDTPTEISNLFDSVSYSKSGCVLRMFQHVLGPAKFQMALSSYLKENSYKVVDEDDLFKHLSTAAGGGIAGLPANSLESFFKSWTNQGGYPILTVTRNYSSGSFQISQEFFDNTNKPTSNALWVVPYNYVYGNNPNFTSTSPDGFLNKVPSVTVDSMSSSNTANEWLLLNKHVTGYYRVNYDAKNWDLLAKQLHKDHTKIHVMNRVQLVDDPIRLAFAGRLDPATALNLLAYIENEEQYAPWAAANNVFNALSTYFLGDANFDVLEYYVRQLVTPIYKKLGAKEGGNDTVHHKLTRNIAINWACRAKVTECIEQTYKRLEEVITKQIEVEPSLKSAIFCNALLKGGEAEFRYIFQRILTSTDQAERRQLMPALGCSRNETLLMEFAMTSTAYSSELNYRIQERINVLSAIIDKNKVGLQTAMKFLKENHGAYYSLGSAGFMDTNPLVSILSSISSRVYSKELVDEFNALLVEVRTGVLGNSTLLTNMKSRAESNLLWVTENREKYVNWLSTFKNSATSSILSTVTLVFTLFVSLRNYF